MTNAARSVGILGTGSYLPKDEITNDEIAERVGVTADWIERKTQILTRRYAAPAEATSDLAAHAAVEALKNADLSADAIDYIVVSTSTPDSPQPPTACLVQKLIEARNAACFDINVVCSGFIYGLALVQGLLRGSPHAKALVIGADLYSRILDFNDRRTAVLLGDGAGAAVVGVVPSPYGILDTALHTQGDAHELINVLAGGTRVPATHDTVDAGEHFFRMHGRGVKDFVLENVPQALADLLARNSGNVDQVDHFVPHQPNGALLDDLVDKIAFPIAQTHRTVEKYANVGSASVPVTLDDANRSGAIRRDDLVLLAGFGGGMSIGGALLRWSL